MFYGLIVVESGNLVGTYGAEAEALAVVRRGAHLNGAAFVNTLALGYGDEDGEGAQLAAGPDLLARALDRDQEKLSRPG